MDTARKSPGFLHLLPLKGGGEWLHMCIRHKETSTYLMDEVALVDRIVDALMEEDTRSRLRVRDEGIMVLLKAMHLRGEDMAKHGASLVEKTLLVAIYALPVCVAPIAGFTHLQIGFPLLMLALGLAAYRALGPSIHRHSLSSPAPL